MWCRSELQKVKLLTEIYINTQWPSHKISMRLSSMSIFWSLFPILLALWKSVKRLHCFVEMPNRDFNLIFTIFGSKHPEGCLN